MCEKRNTNFIGSTCNIICSPSEFVPIFQLYISSNFISYFETLVVVSYYLYLFIRQKWYLCIIKFLTEEFSYHSILKNSSAAKPLKMTTLSQNKLWGLKTCPDINYANNLI